MTRAACEWYFCSSYGTVLVHITANPYVTIADIAEALYLTRRTVWDAIGALRRSGQIDVYRRGRRHYYYANLDAPFLHPTVKGYTIRDIFGAVRHKTVIKVASHN